MADDEIVIKITVDDSELEDVKRDLGTDTGAGDESKIIDEVTGNQGKDSMLDEVKAHGLIAGGMGGIGGGKKALGMAGGMASNPMGAIQGIFQNLGFIKNFAKMIPHVALVIMAIEIVPMVIKQIIEQLTKAGSPFDKRFKRMMSEERNAFFTREEQRKRQLGLSPVIATSISGFRNLGGVATTWTLKEVREQNGVAPIGLRDKAGGVNY
jgi:hypothetical protein